MPSCVARLCLAGRFGQGRATFGLAAVFLPVMSLCPLLVFIVYYLALLLVHFGKLVW